ncbi:hypothetical protein ACTXT7_004523 [Hymenolepis weldensis]
MKLQIIITLLLLISQLGYSSNDATEEISSEYAAYIDSMRKIVRGINEKMNNDAFTDMVMNLPNLDEIFLKMDKYMIWKVFQKIVNPDELLYYLDDAALMAVMTNMSMRTFMKLEPYIPCAITRYEELKIEEEMKCIEDIIYFTSPNTAIEYADYLSGIDVNMLHYIITNSCNLPSLLAAMNPHTLEYVFSNAPYVIEYIILMDPETQYAILSKIPYPCEFLQSIQREHAEIIANALPFYIPCIHIPDTPTFSPEIVAETSGVVKMANHVDDESEDTTRGLKKMSEELPNIKKLLAKINRTKIDKMRDIDFLVLFDGFGDKFINCLKKRASCSMVISSKYSTSMASSSSGANAMLMPDFAYFEGAQMISNILHFLKRTL